METTESLKSKERALSDARKRAAELKNDAQLEKSSADQARKAFAVVEEKRSFERGPVVGRRREVRGHDRIAGGRASGTGPET